MAGTDEMQIFADIDIASALGGGTGAAALLAGIWAIIRQFRKDGVDGRIAEKKVADESEKVKRVDTIAELKGLLDDLRKDFDTYKKDAKAELADQRKQLDDADEHRHECDRKSDRMAGHIFYLEEIIRRFPGAPDFRPWLEVSTGSAPHAPLKESKP